MKTLMGLTLEQLQERLNAELPADAYSAVPGGADLTDIDPNYMRKVLNECFGLCGWGWGYAYNPTDMTTHGETRKTQNGSREVVVATLTHLRFWYKLAADDGQNVVCEIDASGGSDNSNASYAMKGAMTNAIGNAASSIGFQESVYLGKRSHKTVGKKAATKPAATAKSAPQPGPAGQRVSKPSLADSTIEDLDGAPARNTSTVYVVPSLSKAHSGKQITDLSVSVEVLQQWSTIATNGDAVKQGLKQAATLELVRRHGGNGHNPAEVQRGKPVVA